MLSENKTFKRVKAWWDAISIIKKIMIIVGVLAASNSGSFLAGNNNTPEPVVKTTEPAPVVRCPTVEPLTCPTVICGCNDAIKAQAEKHKKEHY